MVKRDPRYRSLLLTGGVLAVVGIIGVYVIMTATIPTVGPRWLFFFFLSAGVTGLALPFIWFLHKRFGRGDLPAPNTMLRQGLWCGFFVTLSIWLQINRSLTLSLVLLMIAGIASVESLLQLFRKPRGRRS